MRSVSATPAMVVTWLRELDATGFPAGLLAAREKTTDGPASGRCCDMLARGTDDTQAVLAGRLR